MCTVDIIIIIIIIIIVVVVVDTSCFVLQPCQSIINCSHLIIHLINLMSAVK